MIGEIEIKLTSGLVRLELAELSGDPVVFLHLQAVGKLKPSTYREWKERFQEILELCGLLGAVEVLSFIPRSEGKEVAKLHKNFGFEVLDELPEGTLTRSTTYGSR